MDVISVHVPKTAGSTFGSLLGTIYGDERVFKDYDDLPMNPLSRYNVDRADWRSSASARIRSIGPEFRAIHGHFAIEKYDETFPEARRIAWVRHPASWVISLYFYWRNVPTTTHPLIRRLHSEGLSSSRSSPRNRRSATVSRASSFGRHRWSHSRSWESRNTLTPTSGNWP